MSHHQHTESFSSVLPAVVLVLALLAGYGALWGSLEQAEAVREYRELRSLRAAGRGVETGGKAETEGARTAAERSETEDASEAAELAKTETGAASAGAAEEEGAVPAEEAGDNPAGASYYDKMLARNPDYAGELLVPALDLDYPIAASHDNEEYLHRTFDGEDNPAGCIFLDCAADREFDDLHTFVFGHNMRDGSMFGSLRRFSQDPGLLEKCPYWYIETRDGTLMYRVFAFGTVAAEDETIYRYLKPGSDYQDWVHALSENCWYDASDNQEVQEALAAQQPIVTLSTCWGTGHKENFAVHGVLTKRKPIE